MAEKTTGEIDIRLETLVDATIGTALNDEELVTRSETDEDFDLIEHLRDRLEIGDEISDVTIAASLAQIGSRGDMRGRWLAAFGSPLGKHLAMRGSDLNTLLNVLLVLAPRHQS